LYFAPASNDPYTPSSAALTSAAEAVQIASTQFCTLPHSAVCGCRTWSGENLSFKLDRGEWKYVRLLIVVHSSGAVAGLVDPVV
jgi:hypothetical protein